MTQPKITSDQINANGLVFTGPLNLGPSELEATDVSNLILESSSVGLDAGGEVTLGVGPLDVNIASGEGYVSIPNPDPTLRKINWSGTTLTLPNNVNSYIYVNSDGVVSHNISHPIPTENIILARVRTESGTIQFISRTPTTINHPVNNIDEFLRDIIGPIFGSGAIVTENVTPRHLDITAGTYNYAQLTLNTVGGTDKNFGTFYNTSGTWTKTAPVNIVSNTQYNNTTTGLVALGAGQYAKHTLYVGGEGADEQYGLVYSQAQYATLLDAQQAALPLPPPYFTDIIVPIAAIIVQQGTANIIQIIDIRPRVGFQAPSTTGSADHGSLLGLTDDDHPQYLLATGTRTLTGDMSFGGNDITNVAAINRVAITAPATSATLTLANTKTLTVNNTVTLNSTDGSTISFGSGGTVAYASGNLSQFASTTSAQLASVISDETGTGALVLANTPTLIAPILGTPTSGTLTNCTGLPISTGVSGLATGIATFLSTPTSANLAAAVTNETGTGALVFANTPTLVTPNIGAATGTSLNVTSDITTGGVITVPKTSGLGIKVDTVTPTYPWRDLTGIVVPRAAAPNAAVLSVFRAGAVREWAFAAGDVSDNRFHIPHDYLPGSDLFVHIHWGHNGTTITGNAVFTISFTYAKGHNQEAFPAETTATLTYNTVNIATTPRYQHRIDEIQITATSPGVGQIASSLIEPDGLILMNVAFTTIPTITGGAPNNPFIFEIDIHYQSTGIGTKQKAPNFYV